MDPDTALEIVISELRLASDPSKLNDPEALWDHYTEALRRLEDIRTWVARGGYNPALRHAIERNFGSLD